MEIPIYIDSRKEGTLTIERRGGGLYLDARLRDVGRVVRLKVYGEREFYLGVPVGEDGGELRLTRRLSPSDARRFPQKPAYAAERPSAARREPEPETEEEKRRVLWIGGKPHYF